MSRLCHSFMVCCGPGLVGRSVPKSPGPLFGPSPPLASGNVLLKAQNEGTASVQTAVNINIVDLLLFCKIIIYYYYQHHKQNLYTYFYYYINILYCKNNNIYIYIYICICVCVCVTHSSHSPQVPPGTANLQHDAGSVNKQHVHLS